MKRYWLFLAHLAVIAIAVVVLAPPMWAQGVITGVNWHRLVDGFVTGLSRAYINDPDTGSYRVGANNEGFVAGGVRRWDYNTTRLNLSSGYVLGWNDDLALTRIGADTLGLRRGANEQTFQIGPAGAYGVIDTASGGTLRLYTTAAASLQMGANNSIHWQINSSGHLLADGAKDLGDGAGNSPRNVYVESFISGVEEAEPAAPAANNYRLYAKDSGGGKTQLCVRFASGASQCFATEP